MASSQRCMLAVCQHQHSLEFMNARVAVRATAGSRHIDINVHATLARRMRAIVTRNPFLCTGSANKKEENYESNEIDPCLSHSGSAGRARAGRSRGDR